MFSEERYMSIEQALLITETYQQNENEPRIVQRAKAFAHSTKNIQIRIDPSELIVGNRSAGMRAGIVFPESGISWIEEEIDTLSSSSLISQQDCSEEHHNLILPGSENRNRNLEIYPGTSCFLPL